LPVNEPPACENPETTVRIREAWPRLSALQDQQLLPEAKIVGDQQRLWLGSRSNRPQQTVKHFASPPSCWTSRRLMPFNVINGMGFRIPILRPSALSPDHMRPIWGDRQTWSVDAVIRRYGCRAFGPNAFDPDMGPPESEVQKILPNHELPGGLRAFRDPRSWNETPLWIPEHRTLVFADALTERAGVLRVWMSPTHEERALPDLRAMLDLPFERVIISHGEPVHTRDAFKRALELPQWPAGPLHLAAYRGNLDRVRSLVEAGADLTARDERFGATVLEWAKKGQHEAVIAYLKSVMEIHREV
jgi:hypothetical protein